MEMLRALVVEPDLSHREFLRSTLQRAGYYVTTASSGEEALVQLRDMPYDLVVSELDLDEYRVDGLQLFRAVKWRWPKAATIIVTGSPTLESAVAAIQARVDGYLLKPVGPGQVLRAAEKALTERQAWHYRGSERAVFHWKGLTLDCEKQEVMLDGQSVHLTPHEFQLLHHLIQNAPRVVSTRELLQAIGYRSNENEQRDQGVLRWKIHCLRRKLESDSACPRYVVTVHGLGYKLGE